MSLGSSRSQSGFTLFELVVILVLMGTLGVSLFLRWSPATPSLNAQAGQLARTLRHAQSLALSQGRKLTLDVRSSTTYAISDAGTVIVDPQGLAQRYNLVDGVSLSGSDLDFDSLGRPVDAGGNLVAAAQSWTLSNGAAAATVSVTPLSGFVTVSP